MPITRLLIANRGEIAIRIGRAAADLGLRSVAVHSRDDARSLHVRAADEVRELPGQGAAAYLDADAVIAAAKASGCDAVHPGYGFLSERADFARCCAKAGLIFVGPTPEHLELFGDKARARTAAVAADVPVIHGMDRAVSLREAQAFFASLRGGAMIIKAIAGGGGRGTRAVFSEAEIDPTYQRCRSEAEAAFGCGDVYVEQYIPRARHIEVQIIGDLSGTVTHLGERECSIQRRFQKIIEVAPAPALDDELRYRIIEAAVRFAKRPCLGAGSAGVFRVAARRRDDHQGGGRRRRARHPRGVQRGGDRSGLSAVPLRGRGCVRLRRCLCRTVHPPRSPYRSADPRRPKRHRDASR